MLSNHYTVSTGLEYYWWYMDADKRTRMINSNYFNYIHFGMPILLITQ